MLWKWPEYKVQVCYKLAVHFIFKQPKQKCINFLINYNEMASMSRYQLQLQQRQIDTILGMLHKIAIQQLQLQCYAATGAVTCLE